MSGHRQRPSLVILGAAAATAAASLVAARQLQRRWRRRKEHEASAAGASEALEALAISSRGARLRLPGLPYLAGVIEGFMNPFEPSTGEGVIMLAVAENKLSWDILKPRIEQGFKALPSWVAGYGPMTGQMMLREPLARFLEARITRVPVAPGELVCATGVAAILSNLFYSICEAGDAVLIPAPYYSAFDSDLRSFCELRQVPVALQDSEGYALTVSALEGALAMAAVETRAAGRGKPRALLLTNPHNPLGLSMTRAELQLAVDWCDAKGLHLVCDEIYALSRFDRFLPPGGPATARGAAASPFVSLGEICKGRLGPRRHVLWGLSKDFCLSGMRFGVLWSQNKELLGAMDSAAVFMSVPGPAQAMVADLLADDAFVTHFLEENGRRLASSCALVMEALDRLSLPYLRPAFGMFLWADLRPLLPLVACSAADLAKTCCRAEEILYDRLRTEIRIVLTPGASQHAAEQGWFRICFATVPPAVLTVALKKLSDWVEELRKCKKEA